jgi:hypothetical protein
MLITFEADADAKEETAESSNTTNLKLIIR